MNLLLAWFVSCLTVWVGLVAWFGGDLDRGRVLASILISILISGFGVLGVRLLWAVRRRKLPIEAPISVFLCHCSADKAKVRELYRQLKIYRLEPWLDNESILPGEKWELEIGKAIEHVDAVVVVLSAAAIASDGFFQHEINLALKRASNMPAGRIFVVPARLDDTELPEPLKAFHAVDLHKGDGFEKLFRTLDAIRPAAKAPS